MIFKSPLLSYSYAKMAGFTLIEIILAIALTALFIPIIASTLGLGLFSSVQGENFIKARSLAEEGMEAIYYLKSKNDTSWNWNTTPINTNINEYYQPAIVGGSWSLGPKVTSLTPIGVFTRKVQIDNHPDPSVPASKSRKITVYVDWMENGKEQELSLISLISKH